MSAIQNLHSFDPFADASKGDDLLPAGTEDYIHIRIQQRNGRKTLTTVQGIADDYDKMKLVKAFKKKFACNGTVIEHPEYGEVIQLQGDQRKNICQFLVEIGLVKDDQLKFGGRLLTVLSLKETEGQRLTTAPRQRRGKRRTRPLQWRGAASAFIGAGAGVEDPGARGVTELAGLAAEIA
ncbi:Eukaryotic translation initiation factor 1 [Galemys pyrenaicus]|uniref:Eukaryotic translation initiation factor 1 n=1 Tax=Galemys pyrenaicus TaxID=202257 RepID=A0A8J5ZT21_GALPY|nr:Eukaryotic translation initiation factor 1 [Galemys pyrenaicus]